MAGVTLEKEREETAQRIARDIFDLLPIGIEIYDPDGRLLAANRTCREILGESDLARIRGKNLFQDLVLSPDDRAALRQGRQVSYQAPTDFDAAHVANRCSTARTGTIHLSVIIEPVRNDPDHAVSSYLVLYQDVTERKLVELSLRESELRFRKVFEDGLVGMVIVDRQLRFQRANPAFCTLVGYAEEELQRLTFRDITHPAHLAADIENVNKVLVGEIPCYRTEKRYVRKDGNIVWGTTNVSIVRDARGEFLNFLTTVEDITESKRAEQELTHSQARTASILAGIADTFYSLDTEWRFSTINPAAEKAPFGRPAAEMLGRVIWDLYPGLVGTRIHQHYLDAAEKKSLEHYEAQSPLNGRWYEVFMQGWSGGVDVYMRDISERKRVEAAMAASEKQVTEALGRLDLAVKSAHLGVWDWYVQSNDMVWDDQMLQMYGYTRETFPGGVEAWQRGLHPDDRARALAESQAALDGTRPFDTEFRIVRPEGQVRWIKADGLVLRDAEGRPVRMLGLNQDVTEAKTNEEAVRENEAIFSTFLEHSPVHVFFKDSKARVLRLSRNYESMLGMPTEQALGKSMDELLPSDLARSMIEDDLRVLREGKRVQVVEQLGEHVYETTKFPIFVDGTAVMLAGFTVDITERRKAEEERLRLQEQLIQAQKMESVGRLAGGVAHDFNNMLGVMLGHLELAEEQLDPSSPIAWNLKEIHQAARRSADLTKQLLAFARKQTIAPKVLDLNETVGRMLAMLRRLVGENIELLWTPGQEIGPIRMDPTQIHQILANLCVNARDAIQGVGHVRISTSKVRVDDGHRAERVDALPGDYVVLTVADDGCGMDPDTITKLFEPFFTTKDLGKGTGLGLSTVHGIVQQNGGHITVQSEPGCGSTFRIYLPAHSRASISRVSPVEAAVEAGGGETILLVEDEKAFLQMTRRILDSLGYKVLAAHGPGEAIRLAGEHAGAIDLLVTDVVMPDMSGRALEGALRRTSPDLRCLFISGYSADFVAGQGALDEGISLLQKPFTRNELAAAVRRVLDSRRA